MSYVVAYDSSYKFNSFMSEIPEQVEGQSCPYHYIQVTKSVKDTLLGLMCLNSDIIFHTNLTSDTVYDSIESICTVTSPSFDLASVKSGLCTNIKLKCNSHIVQPTPVTLSSRETKLFSFKQEDQINLKDFVTNYKEGDTIYYHANGEFDKAYTYEDIVTIYKTLYNNKIYNLIYTQVLCSWISDNLTQEMYEDPNIILEYGYVNDDIQAEVDARYEIQKLS